MTALRLYCVVGIDPAVSGVEELLGAGDGQGPEIPGTSLVSFRGLGAIVEPTSYNAVSMDESELSRHADVVEAAFAHRPAHPILPAPAGVVFKSRDLLTRWLELHYFALTEALSRIEGHVVARVTVRQQGESSQAKSNIIFRALRSKAAAMVAVPGTEHTASFLIMEDLWGSFNDYVKAELGRYQGIEGEVTGPWPPYDFVRMQFGV